VLQWLVDAAEQLQAFSRHLLHDVRVRRCSSTSCSRCSARSRPGRSARRGDRALERSPQWSGSRWTREQTAALGSTSGIVRWRWPSALSTRWRRCWRPTAPRCFSPMAFGISRLCSRTMGTGCGRPAARPRPCAETALDAPAWAALCASGQDRAASPVGPRAASGRVWHPGGGAAGAGGLRLADQYRLR